MTQFNIVLLGKTGSGVSASGNTILQNKMFPSALRSRPTTRNITKGNVTIDGKHFTLYDTPGLFDTGRSNDEVVTQWRSLLQLEELAPTVFLLVIRLGRFTVEEKNTVRQVEEFLGERRLKNTWILFTRGDELESEGITIEDLVNKNEDINMVVERFEGRYHVFNNLDLNFYQVKELIRKITKAYEVSMAKERSVLNLVLLGRTGSGKSASGNTILKNKTFRSALRAKAVTLDIAKGNVFIGSTHITVYDTPGLFDTKRSNEEMKWMNDLPLCQSTPTVYLLVIRPDRVAEEQKCTVKQVEEFLGETRMKNTWILFTRGDELEDEEMTIQDFIEDAEDMKTVTERFGGRYHVFNNKEENPDQVEELIRKITHTHKGLNPGPLPPLQTALPKRRLVLLGKTGAGKSATGNTILGGNSFHSELSYNAVTTQPEVQQAVVAGKLVSVVDTPGLFDTECPQEEIILGLGRSIYESSPGPHAFLIVLPLTLRLTQQGKGITDVLRAVYGEGALKYTFIIFTYGDQLKEKDVKRYIEDNKALSGLVRQCGGRYHVFNNKDKNSRQVTELLDKIDVMVGQNGGSYYTNEMLQDADRCRAEAERREREQEEKGLLELQQRQEEIERAVREAEEEIREELRELEIWASGSQSAHKEKDKSNKSDCSIL